MANAPQTYFHLASSEMLNSEHICIFSGDPFSVSNDSDISTTSHTCQHYKVSNRVMGKPGQGPPAQNPLGMSALLNWEEVKAGHKCHFLLGFNSYFVHLIFPHWGNFLIVIIDIC